MISDHPLAVCAVAVVGTIGICSAVAFQWVVPTMTASITHSLELQKEEVAKQEQKTSEVSAQLSTAKAEIVDLKAEAAKAADQNSKLVDKLRADLFRSQQANAFMVGVPYPVGLESIKVGDPIEKISKFYHDVTHDSKTYRTINTGQQLFVRIAFSFGRSDNNGEVEGVRFSLGSPVSREYAKPPLPSVPDGWLQEVLEKTIGYSPAVIGPEEDCLVWAVKNSKLFVFYKRGDDDYFLSEKLSPAGCYITDEQRKDTSAKSGKQKT